MDRSFTQYDRFLRLIGGHMNFRKLLTYLTVGTAAVIPFAGAQNPTILQGSYISNVFGNSNFVLNPNAQTNIANVTTVTATVARSTTTPLVATSEFTVAIGTANGTATWATRAFDAGMKNNNCEARFTYRGFAATSKVHIKQGANTVASLTLTPATDPRIASINFPCGDLSNPTTFQVTDTAILAGTNEIGGIYVGLATNMANVAQAETVVIANVNAQITIPTVTYTNIPYQSESLDAYGEYNNSTGVFTAKRAGNYFIAASMFWLNSTWGASNIYLNVYKNGSLIVENLRQIPAGISYYVQESSVSISLSVGDTLYVSAYQNDTANRFIAGNSSFSRLSISRFPSSSELVVTPERQNTFAGLKGVASGPTNLVTSAAWTKLTSGTTLTRTTFGKAKVETNNDYSITIENMPVGSYYITATGIFGVDSSASGSGTACYFAIADSATGGPQIASMQQQATGDSSLVSQTVLASTMGGVYTNSSVANKTFYLQSYRGGGGGNCYAFSDSNRPLTITVIPLDQPSNSALYVQGPVLGAQTGAAIPAGYQMEGVANANNLSLTNGQLIRDLSTFVPGARVTQITRTLTPGNYLVTADISCDGMPSGIGLVIYMVADSTSFALSRNIAPTASAYVSNSVTRYLRVTNNMVYKVDAEAGGVISGSCATTSTVLRLN